MITQCDNVADDLVGHNWKLGNLGLKSVQVLVGVLVGVQIFVEVLSNLFGGLFEDQ